MRSTVEGQAVVGEALDAAYEKIHLLQCLLKAEQELWHPLLLSGNTYEDLNTRAVANGKAKSVESA